MAAKQPGNDVVATTAVELIGVALFGIIAGFSDDMGTIMVVLMWGFVIGWLLLNANNLSKMVSHL